MRFILQGSDKIVSELHIASERSKHLMMDGHREVSQLLALLLLLLQTFLRSDVSEIDDLACLIVEREVHALDDEGVIFLAGVVLHVD